MLLALTAAAVLTIGRPHHRPARPARAARSARPPAVRSRYAGGLAVLTAAGLYAPLLVVAAPLAGLCLGPTLATLFGAAASAAPHGGGTETQAWLNSIMNGGAAAGAALAGFAAGPSWRWPWPPPRRPALPLPP